LTVDNLPPGEVRQLLARHILADGMPLLLDLEASHGAWLRDAATGRDYLDFFSSFSTCPIGLNHPRLTDPAIASELLLTAVNKISNSDLYTREFASFVERFAGVLPATLRQHLFFIEGGALAVENALKAAFDWKRRLNQKHGKSARGEQIIHFQEAFHGRSGYTLSLTNTDPTKTDSYPQFAWPRVSNPKLDFSKQAPPDIELREEATIAEIRKALEDNPDDIAGLIIEPMQGEGGDNHFRREFLEALRHLADDNEFLLIFDEVQTGFGTTGRWWCFEHFDVEPDILVFGKKTQVCGIAAGPRLDEVDSVFHVSGRINSTWGGNLVDMVRCRRFIDIIEDEGLLANATLVGDQLLEGLRDIGNELDGRLGATRGRGMFLAFDLPDTETRNLALEAMQDELLLALPSGPRAIRFRPPLSLSKDEADVGLRRCRRALHATFATAGQPDDR